MTLDPKQFLYVSDLDGTLLAPGGTFPREAAERLNRMIERGLNFTIATARNYDSAYPLLRLLNLKIPAILFNGVYLTEFQTGRNVHTSGFLSQGIAADLISMGEASGLDPFVYTYNGGHRVYYRKAANPGAQNYLDEQGRGRLQYIPRYDKIKVEDVSGLLFIDSHAALEPLCQTMKEKYPSELNLYFAEDISMRGHYWLQIFDRNANKGIMLRKLAEYVNVPLSSTVVFGDYLNDLEMFAVAGRAVAVANAMPQVRRAAHQVIGGNDTYAVLDYLESIGFG